MHFVYVLQSLKDNQWYVGRTADLKKRFDDHQEGRVLSTRNRRPFKLVYYEATQSSIGSAHRELYLKTAWGKQYLEKRLKSVYN